MSSEPVPPDPELSALEAALGALAPARGRLDRDRVMFRAGQASARPSSPGRSRPWRAAAAVLALVALGEAALLARMPPPRVVERVVVVREPGGTITADSPPVRPEGPEEPARPAGSLPALGQTAYGRLTGQVLRYGLDGLPASSSAAWADPSPSPVSSGRLLLEELRRIRDPGDPS